MKRLLSFISIIVLIFVQCEKDEKLPDWECVTTQYVVSHPLLPTGTVYRKFTTVLIEKSETEAKVFELENSSSDVFWLVETKCKKMN